MAKKQQLKPLNVAVVVTTLRPLCGMKASRYRNVKVWVRTSADTHSLSSYMLHRVLLRILLQM